MLLRAIRDRALTDPCDEVLVHDVARDESPRRGVGDGAMPVRNTRLLERCGARHGIVEPRDVQRALVVDRHAPLELAREETVRPQADAADRPELVVFRRVFAHAAIEEAPLELLERDL